MALITFEDLPSTNTPINANNLNNNFSELKMKSKVAHTYGTQTWHKILHIPGIRRGITFAITSMNGDFIDIIATIAIYTETSVVANIFCGKGTENAELGYVVNADNSLDVYLYQFGAYSRMIIQPLKKFSLDSGLDEWDVWNSTYPVQYSGTPSLTGKFNYIGNGIYSTNETIVGTWIDGKTLYRKIIDCGALVANSTKTVGTGLFNVTYIDFDGICTRNGDGWPYKMSTATNPAKLTISNNQIQIQVSGDLSTYTGYVTILYTKN